MTAQTPDWIDLGPRKLSIQGVRGTLFDPAQHGLEVTMISTACWRGFVATYALHDNRLILRDLDTRLTESSIEGLGVFFELDVDGVAHPLRHRSIVVGDEAQRDVPIPAGSSCAVHIPQVPPFTIELRTDGDFGVYRRPKPFQRLRDGEPFEVEGHTLCARVVEGLAAYDSARPPLLSGHVGTFDVGRLIVRYQGLDLPIELDGGILACDGFIRELYVHMGFHPAWKFEYVEELIFERGELVHREDVSSKLAEVRGRLAGASAALRDETEVKAWVERCFELDY